MTEVLSLNQENLEKVVQALHSSEPVVVPSETVYGLAANAFDENAVLSIFEMKQRPKFDPLIVHVAASKSGLSDLVADEIVSESVLEFQHLELLNRLVENFFPGPLTILLPKGSKISDLVTAGLPEVAIRCPQHELFQKVLEATRFPLSAPSANRFGQTSPTKVDHVLSQRFENLSYIIDGGSTKHGIESTVVRISSEGCIEILRHGCIAKEQLASFGKVIICDMQKGHLPHAPGMLKKHYAPNKPLIRASSSIPNEFYNDKVFQIFCTKDQYLDLGVDMQNDAFFVLSDSGDSREAAQCLFEVLHKYNSSRFEKAVVHLPSKNEGLWTAITDKLMKASTDYS